MRVEVCLNAPCSDSRKESTNLLLVWTGLGPRMDPGVFTKLSQPLLAQAGTEERPLLTRAGTEESIQAFERKRQEKAERQKNEIIDAATAYREFTALSLHSLTDNAKMLSLSLLFISCHLLTGVLYFHHIVGWPIDGML